MNESINLLLLEQRPLVRKDKRTIGKYAVAAVIIVSGLVYVQSPEVVELSNFSDEIETPKYSNFIPVPQSGIGEEQSGPFKCVVPEYKLDDMGRAFGLLGLACLKPLEDTET